MSPFCVYGVAGKFREFGEFGAFREFGEFKKVFSASPPSFYGKV